MTATLPDLRNPTPYLRNVCQSLFVNHPLLQCWQQGSSWMTNARAAVGAAEQKESRFRDTLLVVQQEAARAMVVRVTLR